MSSSTNLYNYLTNPMSFKMLLNITDDDDDDLSMTTSPTTMTSSDSSDSAIVTDEIDDFDFNNDKQSIMTVTSLSQSFDILNQFKQQTIYENTNQEKYKRPLPWLTSPSSNHHRHHHHPSPALESSSNKVLNYLFLEKRNLKKENDEYLINLFLF
jgi:hypothetical protein